jgi:hypothetical protein
MSEPIRSGTLLHAGALRRCSTVAASVALARLPFARTLGVRCAANRVVKMFPFR